MRVFCALALLAVSGCASTKFTLSRELPLFDTSAVQATLSKKHFSKIIVLRPSGSDSSVFEGLVASFEREFLRHGVTVISGAVTGRVVLGRQVGDATPHAAAQLTDIERALVMAQGTGAEAILQVGRYDLLEDVDSRFLVYQGKGGIREVFRDEYASWTGPKTALRSGASIFAGRLIDVSSGEVVASFQVACASLWSLPADLHGEALVDPYQNRPWKISNTNFPFHGSQRWDASSRMSVVEPPDWERQGRKRCDRRIIDRLVALSLSKAPSAQAESAAPVLDL